MNTIVARASRPCESKHNFETRVFASTRILIGGARNSFRELLNGKRTRGMNSALPIDRTGKMPVPLYSCGGPHE